MRILCVFDNRVPSPQADTEQLVCNLAALSRADADATLLIPRYSGPVSAGEISRYYDVQGSFEVATYPSPAWPRPLAKLTAGLRGALAAREVRDAVVYTRNLPVALGAATRGVPVVHETYRPWPSQYRVLRPALRYLARRPGFLGAVLHSHLTRRSYLDIGFPEEQTLVAHNGFEPARLEPVLSSSEARELLGLPDGRPLIVYTGRVSRDKGLDVVLEVARRMSDPLFLLVGARGEGRFQREARSVSNVELVPWQPFHRISRYLYAADVLLLSPSREPMEGHGHTVLPMKLFSYLPAGRAILGPDREDVREILRDGENARLVAADDPDAAATALRDLLGDAELRGRLAAGARESARGLTWDARARRILDFVSRRLEAGPSSLG